MSANEEWGFRSIVSQIKEKSTSAISTLSSDLQEFSNTLRKDVSSRVGDPMARVRTCSDTDRDPNRDIMGEEDVQENKEENPGKAMKSLFSFGSALETFGSQLLHGAEDLLTGGNTRFDEEDYHTYRSPLDPKRLRLLAMQQDPETYLVPPDDIGAYTDWLTNVDFDRVEAQQRTLGEHPAVGKMFKELVPGSSNAEDFWGHYLYKVSLLDTEESRRAKLFELAHSSEEEIRWDMEEDAEDENPQRRAYPPKTSSPHMDKSESSGSCISAEGCINRVESSNASMDSWVTVDEANRSRGLSPLPVPVREIMVREELEDEDSNWCDDSSDNEASASTQAISAAGYSSGCAPPNDQEDGAANCDEDGWGEWD